MLIPTVTGKLPNFNGAYVHGNQHFIELRNVVKAFKTEAGVFRALKGVSLKADRGEFVAIIGKSGSGKSTLMNMLTGIDRPSSGDVLVGDTAVHMLKENQMAVWRGKNLGVVFQFFQLLPTLTLLDNVMLPMDFCNTYAQHERRAKAMQALELVGIAEQALKRPSACSGGQQQRAAIARALAHDPAVLVADEPTGNLDSKTANAIFDLFHTLADKGKTVLMVTHDVDLASRVTRAVHMADGAIVDETVNASVISSPVEVEEAISWPTPTPSSALAAAARTEDNSYWKRRPLPLSEEEKIQAQHLRAQTTRSNEL
jgi:putative ABC transport system ATP-binding protein